MNATNQIKLVSDQQKSLQCLSNYLLAEQQFQYPAKLAKAQT
jgi:hypothetical protein